MGRPKIKKKGEVIPLRQTMAYRMMLLTLSIAGSIFAFYETITALSANNTVAFIVTVVVTVALLMSVFYNFDRLRFARIPRATAKRMQRR